MENKGPLSSIDQLNIDLLAKLFKWHGETLAQIKTYEQLEDFKDEMIKRAALVEVKLKKDPFEIIVPTGEAVEETLLEFQVRRDLQDNIDEIFGDDHVLPKS